MIALLLPLRINLEDLDPPPHTDAPEERGLKCANAPRGLAVEPEPRALAVERNNRELN